MFFFIIIGVIVNSHYLAKKNEDVVIVVDALRPKTVESVQTVWTWSNTVETVLHE